MLLPPTSDPLTQALYDLISDGVFRAEALLDQEVMNRAPVDTTALQQSITVDSFFDGDAVTIIITTDDAETSQYGFFQDVGTVNTQVNVGWFTDTPFLQILNDAFDNATGTF